MSQHDPEQTARNVRSVGTALHQPTRPRIMGIHDEATKIANGGGDDPTEFVVSIEISDVLIVRAESEEEALATAVLATRRATAPTIETVSHDVHACVHSGDDTEDAEGCGGHEHEGDDEE